MADIAHVESARYFDWGIEKISGSEPSFSLPEISRHGALPQPTMGALEKIFSSSNLDFRISAWARPDVDPNDFTSPGSFQAALARARSAFEGSSLQRRHANPALSKTLNVAAAIVSSDLDLRAMLQEYRQALLKG